MSTPIVPLHLWTEMVQREARSFVPHNTEWRRRFRVWYDAGETVSAAASMLREMVLLDRLAPQ